MQIEIQARDFSLTPALRGHIERRLGFAFSSRFEHIQRIQVRVMDINGPRGGNDKCCQIQIMLAGYADVIIEDTEADLYLAISRAAERASRIVTRRLAKQRGKERSRHLSGNSLPPDLTHKEHSTC